MGREPTHGNHAGADVGTLPGAHQDELDREARRLLDAEVERLEAAGISVTQAHLRSGRADEQTIVMAEELGADLIVVGSRGMGGLRRALLGSVSDSGVRHARCPVMVVREERPREPAGTPLTEGVQQ